MTQGWINPWNPIENHVARKHRLGHMGKFTVVTDKVSYDKPDQVLPIHPENVFFVDELVEEKVIGAQVLEIGLGSSVLSIAAAKAGAEKVTALEINPRAKIFAGYNIMMNGLEDKVDIRDGDTENVFKPVEGEKFDYLICNPPFEPTPPGIRYYLHSSAGIYGLDFVERIFKGLDDHLTEEGHAQIVTFAPGGKSSPWMLADLVKRALSGQTTIKVNPLPIRYDDFVDRFAQMGKATVQQIEKMKRIAKKDGISHLYLCMVHYEKGKSSLTVKLSDRTYQKWDLPQFSDVPMGVTK